MDNGVSKPATTFNLSTEVHDIKDVGHVQISWFINDIYDQAAKTVPAEKWHLFSKVQDGKFNILLASTISDATEEYVKQTLAKDETVITSKSAGKQWMLDADQDLRENFDESLQKVGLAALRATITETGFAGAIIGDIKGLSISERGVEDFYPTRKPKLAQGCYPVGFNFPLGDNELIIVGTSDFWDSVSTEQGVKIVAKTQGTDQAVAALIAAYAQATGRSSIPRAIMCLSRRTASSF